MEVSFVVFLWVYLAAVLVVLLFASSSLYHLMRFGFLGSTSVAMTFVLIAGTVFILFVSYLYLSEIDWTRSLNLEGFIVSLNPLTP